MTNRVGRPRKYAERLTLRAKPTVGQLRSGKWVVFNVPKTMLWTTTYRTREIALRALDQYRGEPVDPF